MLQYGETDSGNLKQPKFAVGGFRTSLFDSQLRIDNTQHAISSFAKGIRFIFEKQPINRGDEIPIQGSET